MPEEAMKRWFQWIFRGHRELNSSVEVLSNRISDHTKRIEKAETACLNPDGSLAMAWKRIEALEERNTKLAAAHLALQDDLAACMQELNSLRQQKAETTPAPTSNVRRVNWGAFRAAAEAPRTVKTGS